MSTQELPTDLAVAVSVVADDYRAAMLRTYAGVRGAPSDPYVASLLYDMKRAPHDHRRVKLPDMLARIHVTAQRDGARPAGLLALPRAIESFVCAGTDDAPPPAHLRLLSVEEQRAQQPLDLMQCELTPDVPDSTLYAIVEACEAQEAATKKLKACAKRMIFDRASDRARAKQQLHNLGPQRAS